MSKEGSVAPKERVNIRYRPSTEGAQEEVELPLRLLVLGDFTQREDDTPLEDRKRINVDKDNFNDVMRAQNLSVSLSVKNTLKPEDGDVAVKLKFETLDDFKPEKVAENVPALKEMLELRAALNALRGPLGNVPAFRRKIQEMLGDASARDKLLAELNLSNQA